MNLYNIINIAIKEEFPDNEKRRDLIEEVIKLYVGGQTDVINVLFGERRCDNCNYFYESVHPRHGDCRFNAPPNYPKVPKDHWCGKFEKKVDVLKKEVMPLAQ